MGSTNLASLIEFSRDGEWGINNPQVGYFEMAVIRGTDFDSIREGRTDSVPTRYIKEHIVENKKLYGGEILLETAGGSKGRITGRSIYLKPETIARFKKPVTCASFSRFIRLKNIESINKNYVFWLLQYLYHFGSMNKYHTQHTGVSRFQWTIFAENEMFDLPYIKTQKKIAATLSAYDDLIENNLRRIKILEEMAQNLYREWFVNFRFPGHENARFVDSPLGKIPERWEPVPVKDFLSKNIGGSWGKEEISGDYQSKVRVIRGTDFSRIKVGTFDTIPTRYIKPKELNNRMLEAGDLLIENSVNASSRCVGTPQIITQGILKRLGDPTICASFCKLYRPKTDKYTVFLYLHMNYLLEENKMNFYQNVAANGIGNFQSQRFLQDEMIIVPSKGAEFDKLLSSIKPLLTSLYAEKTDILRQTRDLLLPKLISGEVDVSELDIKMPVEVAI